MFDLEDEKPVSFVFCWWVAILNRLALIIGWPLCLLTREHRFIYTNSSCPHMQILCQKPCITQQLHTGCPRWPLRIKALLPRLCACSDVKQAPNWKKKRIHILRFNFSVANRHGFFDTAEPRTAFYHMKGVFGFDILRARDPNYLWKISKGAIKSVITLKTKNLWLLASAMPVSFSPASARTVPIVPGSTEACILQSSRQLILWQVVSHCSPNPEIPSTAWVTKLAIDFPHTSNIIAEFHYHVGNSWWGSFSYSLARKCYIHNTLCL